MLTDGFTKKRKEPKDPQIEKLETSNRVKLI
jgi:hypothetical protein